MAPSKNEEAAYARAAGCEEPDAGNTGAPRQESEPDGVPWRASRSRGAAAHGGDDGPRRAAWHYAALRRAAARSAPLPRAHGSLLAGTFLRPLLHVAFSENRFMQISRAPN